MKIICKNFKFKEKILYLKKISKFSRGNILTYYTIIVCIGDNDGGIGIGKYKGKNYIDTFNKSTLRAKKNFKKFFLFNNTISHEIVGKHCNTKIILIPIKYKNYILVSGCVREVFNVMGVNNIKSKIYGSRNKYNIIHAL